MCEAIENYGKYREERGEKTGEKQGRKQGRVEGRKQGRIEGRKQGIEETRVSSIQSLMTNLNISITEAMKLLNIPKKEYKKYLKLDL